MNPILINNHEIPPAGSIDIKLYKPLGYRLDNTVPKEELIDFNSSVLKYLKSHESEFSSVLHTVLNHEVALIDIGGLGIKDIWALSKTFQLCYERMKQDVDAAPVNLEPFSPQTFMKRSYGMYLSALAMLLDTHLENDDCTLDDILSVDSQLKLAEIACSLFPTLTTDGALHLIRYFQNTGPVIVSKAF